ncbi:hypothetical protein RIEGSTA812A_PEG_1212 [invertebrate metagenome]|uniref:Uncharacterized protein n=1 Tax=invertebrate metagenome TaxID=1711999 RepID=A0A484H6Q7_9ZZZZ
MQQVFLSTCSARVEEPHQSSRGSLQTRVDKPEIGSRMV